MLQRLKDIRSFLKPHADLPGQGTPEWKAGRMLTIGGSELEMLLKDEKRLVGQKCGLIRGMGDNILACNWGSIFEPTFRNITAIVLKTPIFEASSIPSREVAGKTYSMDGIGVVRYRCDEWNGTPYDFFMYLTTLFEYKCTLSREPTPGVVYAAYVPQVKSGMCDLGIPEIALYMESVFRISRFEELGNTPHVEDWLHQSRAKTKNWLSSGGNPYRQLPMCYGFIGFYMLEAAIPDDPEAGCIYEWLRSGNMDFAKLESQGLLNRLFRFVRAGHILTWGSAITIQGREWSRCPWFASQRIPVRDSHYDMDCQAVAFHRWCEDQRVLPLGVLGWKLLDINVVTVEKEVGYTKRYEPEIKAALEKIKRLNAIEDIGERQTVYNQMYAIEDHDHAVSEDLSSSLADLIM